MAEVEERSRVLGRLLQYHRIRNDARAYAGTSDLRLV